MAFSLASVTADLEGTSALAREVDREIKQLTARQEGMTFGALTEHAKNYCIMGAIILYGLASFNVDAAAAWLRERLLRSLGSAPSAEDLGEAVEDWFLAMPMEVFDALMDPDGVAERRCFRDVFWWYWCWQAARWVKHLNTNGVTPSTGDVHSFIQQGMSEHALGMPRALAMMHATAGAIRVFGTRWRRRFGVGLGRLPDRPDLSQADFEAKVAPKLAPNLSSFWQFFVPVFLGFLVPKCGSEICPTGMAPIKGKSSSWPVFGAWKMGRFFFNF